MYLLYLVNLDTLYPPRDAIRLQDRKFFFKWTTDGRPMLIIAHSDDFRWFGPSDKLDEWDLIIATFNAYKYEVTDATDKEFVGIRIQRDEDGTYYIDQHRMIDSIIKEANISGAKDMHLPYPTGDQEPALSKNLHRTLSFARFWHPALEDSSIDVASQPRPTSLILLESCSCNFLDGLDE